MNFDPKETKRTLEVDYMVPFIFLDMYLQYDWEHCK